MSGSIGIGSFFAYILNALWDFFSTPAISGAIILFFSCVCVVGLCMYLEEHLPERFESLIFTICIAFFVLALLLPLGFLVWRLEVYGT